MVVLKNGCRILIEQATFKNDVCSFDNMAIYRNSGDWRQLKPIFMDKYYAMV